MHIAVIADTHDKIPPFLPGLLGEADEIWHLGDVCSPASLSVFEQIGPPLLVVRGNCDSVVEWPITLDLARCGWRIHLVHVPPHEAPAGTELLFHGHTHVPRNERVGEARFYNPGCITRPNRGAPASFAWLDLAVGESPKWELHRL